MAQQNVTLQPGESKQVPFEAIPHEARVYQVTVDGLTASFVAKSHVIASGSINILDINGIPFASAEGAVGVLAEPIVVPYWTTLTEFRVRWKSDYIRFDEDHYVGIRMELYLNSFNPLSYDIWQAPIACHSPAGCPPGVRDATGIFGGTMVIKARYRDDPPYRVPGIYTGRISLGFLNWDAGWVQTGEFTISNMLRITG